LEVQESQIIDDSSQIIQDASDIGMSDG